MNTFVDAGGTKVQCPNCQYMFDPGAIRVTEATATATKATTAPYGQVEYADPGYQGDKQKRYPIDTEAHTRSAWSYINQAKNAAKYSAGDLQKVKARIKAAAKKFGITISDSTTEALIDGKPSFSDIRAMVADAVNARIRNAPDYDYGDYACITDLTDSSVVYEDDDGDLWQCDYSLDGDTVTLGDPVEVARTYAPDTTDSGDDDAAADDMPMMETACADVFDGRVIEAKGTDKATGGRIFGVQIIAYGDSKNGRRYSESVLRGAAPLYDGAKAYDHHRSDEEMANGTIQGLVGYYRNPAAGDRGIEADLHLLPSATHAAEALDAALALGSGAPLIGISHDVYARFRSITENGRHINEATEITGVNSADLVSHPAAGGAVTRAVAGGITRRQTEEIDVPVKTSDVLAAVREASDEDLAAVGLTRTAAPAPGEPKTSFLGRMLIRGKIEDAGLPVSTIESVTAALPERITEADVDTQVAAVKAIVGNLERGGLVPTVTAQVTQEALDKKVGALDAFFAGDYSKGYRSFRQAFVDVTGANPRNWDEDFNRTILQESYGAGYGTGQRASESLQSGSWNLILGDSVTRRMVAEYGQPNLQTWRQITSSIVPVNDFRTQRLDRLGGYGVLPAVNQGAPYQPLTSPTNEEATYAITKRGGTEDLTLEMIANDDIRSIQRIPVRLGLAAAQTLFRFVWDILPTNAAATYDSTALFHVNHSNVDNPAVLGQSTLSGGRLKMRQQTAYGDTKDVLSIIPQYLVVPSALEEIAWQLCTSAVAIPATPAGPTNTPNIHQGMTPLVIDYYSATATWYIVCDPAMCPTIEVGFYQGRDTPELFTQADQTIGSMFDADKLTYKIRHIYSGTVIDHRGFYRGN